MAAGSTQFAIPSVERPVPPGRRRHGQRGGALLEFVIVLPVLVMVVFGVWEFGRIFDAWLVATNAAREGARYAVEWRSADGPFTTYVQGKVMDYVLSGYGSRVNTAGGGVRIYPDTDITVTPSASGSGAVTVAVTAHVDIWAPGPYGGGSFGWSFFGPGGTFDVHAWTTMYK